MEKYKCIIIEDEPLALERTVEYVKKVSFLELTATFDNSLDGLSYLTTKPVDILFLDINMDELSGVELLESSRVSAQVIITTAYQQYALKGYELNVTDYLLKPFTFQRFLQAATKAQENLTRLRPGQPLDFVFIKTEHRLERVVLEDILYIEGMRDYLCIHTTRKKIMTLQNFAELEQILPPQRICRVHKSYMVALTKIEAVERGRILIGARRIPISATYKDHFYAIIGGKSQ